ncbi:SDR family NAD(P)-dependent oxidoreductase [Shewanella sp. 1CM18E]|uniref:SDR family NAD(P)-dependent oxidoreductase n=1 Tax=Shewanella sp. 1CM18E TaxID=2929169 RepID=UPI0020C03DE7|nr:SDR family NAD(P)-dependent oxidoreductase [Shewanella sp. 1CM18E]MCK8047025.1 SDR family NAD(P)-dependent oxidoreductase [Shewanella sp. 1CM18E]
MHKTILVTGATDGIGLVTVKMLAELGHSLIIHGRTPSKVEAVANDIEQAYKVDVATIVADLSSLSAVHNMVAELKQRFNSIDVVINNAGVYAVNETRTVDNLDVRFAVNTVAAYILTKDLLPLIAEGGRIVNLSSAAQASVDLTALKGDKPLADGQAYAQSKLALTMFSRSLGLAEQQKGSDKVIVSVNPKSLLGSKMVKTAYGIAGGDLSIGADILIRAALSDEFLSAAGQYFDNDIGAFASPHPDALNRGKVEQVLEMIESVITANAANN